MVVNLRILLAIWLFENVLTDVEGAPRKIKLLLLILLNSMALLVGFELFMVCTIISSSNLLS